jgi:hypothetical protein
MAPEGRYPANLERLVAELAEIKSRREALLKEKQIYWRLGFSRDRINVLLRQVDIKQAHCEEQIKALRNAQRASAAYNGLEQEFNRTPAS